MTSDEFFALALALPETAEATYYGVPAVKRIGRAMFALRDESTVSIKVDWDTHDRLLEASPTIYYKTPHHEGWPWFLVRLERLSASEAKSLLQASWEDAPHPGRRMPHKL